MGTVGLDVVTGAFGYTGRYITRLLLCQGKQVRTLTGHPDRPDPFGGRVSVFPFDFNRPDDLARSLQGVGTLYNTYWIRFPHGGLDFKHAVENTLSLLRAAKKAGVHRIVHVSITNPSKDSFLPYFKGKAEVEEAIIESGLSYAIIRPAVIFGQEDILINNIAVFLRRFPVFFIPGSGDYHIQPIFVEDMAELAVEAGEKGDNMIFDAVGPEVFTFEEMVRLIGGKIGSRAKIVRLPPGAALFAARVIGLVVKDVVLTADEIKGLMANLLVSAGPPTGRTRLSEWLQLNAHKVGTAYASELGRHYR